MHTRIIEASGIINWGKFLIGSFDEEWEIESAVSESGIPLLREIGWGRDLLLVLDLQTGEGAIFRPGGYASHDLDKHSIHVCPLFEPFLEWLYQQDISDLSRLPAVVDLPDAPAAIYGYRRSGARPALDSPENNNA